MANLQYIGARYVPKFFLNPDDSSNDWKSGVDYEALTIVTYNNDSYTSKKPVPDTVGDPATNPDYWACTTRYTAAFMALQTTVGNLANTIGNLRIHTPEDFGAVGDGFTDDTQALQDCVDNSDIVIFDRVYYMTSTVTVPAGVKIYGTNGTIVKTSVRGEQFVLSGNNEICGVTFTDNLAYDVTIGAVIYAKDVNNIVIAFNQFGTIGQGHCILLEHCNNCEVKYNRIENYCHSGIMLLDTCKYCDIEFNAIVNSRYTGGSHTYPICFSGYQLTEHGPAEFIKVNYNRIVESTPTWEGIDSHGAKNYEVRHNVIIGSRSGMNLGSRPTSIAVTFTEANTNANVSDNYIDVGAADSAMTCYGIQFSEDATATADHVTCCNNTIKVKSANADNTAVFAAISLRFNGAFRNAIIQNNNIDVVDCHGIALDGTDFDTIIIDSNIFESMICDNAKVYGAIDLHALDGYDNITISNNSIDDGVSGVRFFYGNNNAPNSNRLIDYFNNQNNGLQEAPNQYTTVPRGSLVANTISHGVLGQFIPSTNADAVAGWYCKSAGNWLEISGTAI